MNPDAAACESPVQFGTYGGISMRSNHQADVFWRWWTAGTISAVGSSVGAVALPLTALLILDASPFEMGVIAAASYVAWLLVGLPAGVIVQRMPLRGTQVTADLARAVAVSSIPIAWWLGHLTVTQLVIVALVISFCNVLFDVANATFLPSIVDKAQLESRNSLTSGTHAVTQLSGPPLGGAAVAVLGAVPTLLVDTASYLVSAILLRTLPARSVDKPAGQSSMLASIREGWHFVSRHPVMAPCTWAATALCVAAGAQFALYPLYLVRTLEAPTALVGVLLAVESIGSLLAAALTPWLTNLLGSARALLLAGSISVIGGIVVPIGSGWRGYLAFGIGSATLAFGVVVLSVITRTYRQIASPPELLSRVMATVRFVTWGAVPFGGLVAGALAGFLGTRATLFVFIAAVAVALLVMLFSPIRRLRNLTDYAAPERIGQEEAALETTLR